MADLRKTVVAAAVTTVTIFVGTGVTVEAGSGRAIRTVPARVSRALARVRAVDATRYRGGVPVVVGLAADADPVGLAASLTAAGARVAWLDTGLRAPQLGVLVPGARLATVRDLLDGEADVAWADLQPPVRLQNRDAAWRCQSGRRWNTPLFDRGLFGAGQVVAVMDTGVDVDSCYFFDRELGLPPVNDDQGTAVDLDQRKVIAVDFYWDQDWPDPSRWDWDSAGHGTHVAASAAGDEGDDGRHSGWDGMAPAALLVIQDGGWATDDCGDLPGLGCPMRSLEPVLAQAWAQGARIHTNSWGDEENLQPFGRYTQRTADVDRFCWNHKEFLVLFAAGNAGPRHDTVISPSTGKNVISVGAALEGWTEPPCVAAFSSRGWTDDGRIKPDLVAPGQSVVSAASDHDVETFNCSLREASGTSMATPTVAGLAALVREYYQSGWWPAGRPVPASAFAPSAALVKATLIASTVDLSNAGMCHVDPVPSRDQGWGLVQLDRALYLEGDRLRLLVVDHRVGFSCADETPLRMGFTVTEPSLLKVVLVWTDPPSSSLAVDHLINDLDLVVVGPDGRFLGNVLAAGQSVEGGDADRRNNVEVVWLDEASTGRWTFTVRPHAIRRMPQDYALVVVGAVESDQPRDPSSGRVGR